MSAYLSSIATTNCAGVFPLAKITHINELWGFLLDPVDFIGLSGVSGTKKRARESLV